MHTLFYFLHNMMSPQMTKIGFPHIDTQLIVLCWWWCHNWLGICDAHMWKVISNSLDIDFIHRNIHGRFCKKKSYIQPHLVYGIPLYWCSHRRILTWSKGWELCHKVNYWEIIQIVINWLYTLHNRRDHFLSVMMFKAIYGITPQQAEKCWAAVGPTS